MSNGRPWSSDEIATLRRMVRSRMSDVEIGAHLKRHPKLVGAMRRDLDLEPGQPAALRAMIARLHLRRLPSAA